MEEDKIREGEGKARRTGEGKGREGKRGEGEQMEGKKRQRGTIHFSQKNKCFTDIFVLA